jgi:hypothetical protein
MAQNTNIDIAANTWTLLTDSDVTALTFQVLSQNFVYIKATVGATAPTTTAGSIIYDFTEGEANASLEDLFPGVSGANRVYAYPGNESGGAARVMVSHA